MRRNLKIFLITVLVLLVVIAIPLSNRIERPLPSGVLGDGRVIEVEALTFGTNHVVGRSFPLPKALQQWLPSTVVRACAPRKPRQTVMRDTPKTILWINAIDSTGAYVKCDDLSVKLVVDGVPHSSVTRHWLQADHFYRMGIEFPSFQAKSFGVEIQDVPKPLFVALPAVR